MLPFARIYKIVSQIPKGKVSTYQKVAILASTTAQIVGFALHSNKDPKHIPCHRVLSKKGKLAKGYAFGGIEKQRELLLREGVVFLDNDTVDLASSFHHWEKIHLEIILQSVL